jgi:hypothetical protein
MRGIKILIFVLLCSAKMFAQTVQPMSFLDYTLPGQINIGNGVKKNTHSSAYLEIGPTTGGSKGFIPPRVTQTQRDAIPSPAQWLTVINTTTGHWNVFDGTWKDISGGNTDLDTTRTSTQITVASNTGNDAVIKLADIGSNKAGLISAAQLQLIFDSRDSLTKHTYFDVRVDSVNHYSPFSALNDSTFRAKLLNIRLRTGSAAATSTAYNVSWDLAHLVDTTLMHDSLNGIRVLIAAMSGGTGGSPGGNDFNIQLKSGSSFSTAGGDSLRWRPGGGLANKGYYQGNTDAYDIILKTGDDKFAFRATAAPGWTDNEYAMFFQVGDITDKVGFTAKSGTIMDRLFFSSNATQFTRGSYTTLPPPVSGHIAEFINDADALVSFIDNNGDITVPDEAYNATNWNSSLEVPTKNAVRDKIESIGTIYTTDGTLTTDRTVSAGSHRLTFSTTGGSDLEFTTSNTVKLRANGILTLQSSSSYINAISQMQTRDVLINDTYRLHLGSNAGDLSSPSNGDIGYNSSTNKFRAYENGAWVDMIGSGGSGETNTGSSLGGGLDIYSTKVGVDLRFNTLTASDFNLASNLISIDYTNGQAASGSVKGFLTSTDWTTFNGKQAAITTAANQFIIGTGTNTMAGNSSVTYASGELKNETSSTSRLTLKTTNSSEYYRIDLVSISSDIRLGGGGPGTGALFIYENNYAHTYAVFKKMADGGGIGFGGDGAALNFETAANSLLYIDDANDKVNVGMGNSSGSEKFNIGGYLTLEAPSYSSGGLDFLILNQTSGRVEKVSAPHIVATGDITGATGTTSMLSYTTPNDGTISVYNVGVDLYVSAISGGTITTTVTYTDEGNVSRTKTFFTTAASPVSAVAATGLATFPVITINALYNTSVTVTTTLSAGTVSYSHHSYLEHMYNLAL